MIGVCMHAKQPVSAKLNLSVPFIYAFLAHTAKQFSLLRQARYDVVCRAFYSRL